MSKMTFTLTNDERWAAHFDQVECGVWGTYIASVANVDAWMAEGVEAMERRICEVQEGCYQNNLDETAQANFALLCAELPPIAKAIMCGEWGAP